MVKDFSLEFYLGLLAVFFTVIGIWVGMKLTTRKHLPATVSHNDFLLDEELLKKLSISKQFLWHANDTVCKA
jgi:hypothetical protein